MKTSQKLTLADFLTVVPGEYRDFVTKTSEAMLKCGYKQKIEKKASGLAATYNTPECKRVHLQFWFNKSILSMNLHPIFFNKHNGFLDGLPVCIVTKIDEFRDCRHVADPNACNPKCYECKFSINEKQYHKCNYNCIIVEVNGESAGLLSVIK